MEEYKFLSWLDEHVSGCQTLSNLSESSLCGKESIQEDSQMQLDDNFDTETYNNSDPELDDPLYENKDGFTQDHVSAVPNTTQKFCGKEPKPKKVHGEAADLEKLILRELKADKNDEKHPEDLFGTTIAAELKQLDQKQVAWQKMRSEIFFFIIK